MSISKIDIDEVIYKLLQGLRQKGFSIGTDAYIKTTELFHWFLKEKKGNSFTDFAPYLAPLICKSDEEQTNFKPLFQALFTNEFTAFENSFFAERNHEAAEASKKYKKLLNYLALAIFGSGAFFAVYKIWQYKNIPPTPIYENLLTQPFYVNRNDTVSLTENDVFKNMKDTSKFNVEYDIRNAKQKRKGFSAKHYFRQYGKDTISVKITSIKPGIDSTKEFSEIFVGPEKPTITSEQDEIEIGDENTFTANIDSTINTGFYWEVKKLSSNNDTIKPVYTNSKTIKHVFNEEGEYVVSIKYDKSTSPILKNFPDEKLTASIYQKVKKPGLELDINQTLPLQTTNTIVNKWWLAGLSLLALLFCYLAYRVFKNNIKKITAVKNSTTDIFSGDKPPYDLKFLDRNKNISYTYDLLRLSNHLKKRIDSPDFFLDISKTIKQSIANRGFPTPGFSQKQQTRQCLFLIDQAYKNSQQVKLFSYLAMYLIKHQVKLDFYFYYQTPDKFYTDEDGPRTTLQTLKDRYYNCTLIFFTDGTNFPEYNAAILKESITIGFAYWQQRLLVTPVNYNDWGRNEKLLSTFFNVIPADVVGLLELIRAMDTDSSDVNLLYGQLYSYQSKHVDFNTVIGLQEYLKDEELFQWLCALAIHPKIYWEVILEIGKAIVANPAKINYENLLKLARIQWVHEGNFPTATRLELLKVLTSENEIKARDTFLKMLDEIPMGDEQFSYEEKQISRYANSFVLYATGIQKYTADENIKDGEEKFITLYKNKNLSDNAFKIYIEKKEIEQGNWNTPIINENKNIGIEKYIHSKEEQQLNINRNLQSKYKKMMLRYASFFGASLLLLGYIFFNKNAIAKSRVNDYLKITDTSIQTANTTIVELNTKDCFTKLLLSSKDTTANLEILNGTTILNSRNITPVDSLFVTSILKNLNYDSNKTLTYKLTINGELFIKEMPLVAGTHNISLIGCEKNEQLNVTYKTGYNEDTTAVFNAFKETGYLIKVIPTSDYDKQAANRVTFDSAIGKNNMFTYGDNLIKNGFPLKNITIYNEKNTQKNIVIDGQKELDALPTYTTKTLKSLLLDDTLQKTVKAVKSSIKILYAGNISISTITQTKNCLQNNFIVTNEQKGIAKTTVNQIKYFNENFKDSLSNILACLKTYFPQKTFAIVKASSKEANGAAAEIQLFDETKNTIRVSITVSDDVLTAQANKLRDNLIKNDYTCSPLTSSRNINASVIEYHYPEQLADANNIKRIYSNYFRTSQISLQYSPDPKNSYINIRIKKLNEPVKDRLTLTDVKFPKTINVKDKFPVAFVAAFNQPTNSGNMVYTGEICLSKVSRLIIPLNSCKNISFKKAGRVIISEEIDASGLSAGTYYVNVKIDKLLDTNIGKLTITERNVETNNNVMVEKSNCDTVYYYTGSNKYDISFKGENYSNTQLKQLGINLSLLERDAKMTLFSIAKDKCPEDKISFYAGETKTITFCDGTKATLKMINWQNEIQYKKTLEAIFDITLCQSSKNNRRVKAN